MATSPDGHEIEIRLLGEGFGAEIHGVDLATGLSDAVLAELRTALANYGVIFFREQKLTPEQHLGFAERWGNINVNRFFRAVDGYPKIAEVCKEPHQRSNIGGAWHTDHSYDDAPAMGSILFAREVPDTGGDTLYASLALAYESLSDGLKQTLEGLEAIHSSRHVFGEGSQTASDHSSTDLSGRIGNPSAATQDAVHRVVIRHPETGRKILYVNPGFTVRFAGWSAAESEPLLRYLYDHATRPERTLRFQWKEGSIAFWDNRSTWHYALNDYHGHRRLMHRITIEGVPLS